MANERLRQAIHSAGYSIERLARTVGVDPKTAQRWVSKGTTPHPEHQHRVAGLVRARQEDLWPPKPTLPATPDSSNWSTVRPPDPGGLEAIELMRRVEASDTGPATLTAIERGVDQLCRSYTHTPSEQLLPSLNAYQGYIARLLDGRATLSQRRDLMAQAGWLSLLTATVNIDMGRTPPAAVNLDAARALGHEVGDESLVAWVAETEGWQALTEGRYQDAATACEAGLRHAPADSSAQVQLLIQLARASARLGLAKETYRLVDEGAAVVDRMPPPEHPEHHYVFDPHRLVAYSAAALVWLADDDVLAEGYARRAVAQYSGSDADGRWVRRLALAQIDLGLVLARSDQPAEAAHLGSLALGSWRLVRSDVTFAAELDESLVSRYRDVNEVRTFHEQYMELIGRAPAASDAPETPPSAT